MTEKAHRFHDRTFICKDCGIQKGYQAEYCSAPENVHHILYKIENAKLEALAKARWMAIAKAGKDPS